MSGPIHAQPAVHPNRPVLPIWLTFVGLTMLTGCGGDGEVCGKVTYRGKALATGTVMLVGKDGTPRYGPIGQDGSFKVGPVPVGEAIVTISSPKPGEVRPARPVDENRRGQEARQPPSPDSVGAVDPELAKKWFPIPDQYSDPGKSGLKVIVSRGTLVQDLELK